MNKYINSMRQSLTERWALLLVAFFGLSMTAVADTNLYIPDFSIKSGETKTVEVYLDNDEEATVFQFDMALPDGFTFVDESEAKTSRLTGRGVNIEAAEVDGKVRFSKTGGNNVAVGTGAVLTFQVKASGATGHGVYDLELTNIVISNPGAEQIGNSESTTKITVPEPAALKDCVFGATVESFEIAANQEYQVDITLSYDEAIDNLAAFSGKLTLPAGLEIVPGEDGDFIYSDRLPEPLEFTFPENGPSFNDGKTFILSSTNNTLIAGVSGVIFSFKVKAKPTLAKNSEIVLSDLQVANNEGGTNSDVIAPVTIQVTNTSEVLWEEIQAKFTQLTTEFNAVKAAVEENEAEAVVAAVAAAQTAYNALNEKLTTAHTEGTLEALDYDAEA